MAVPFFMVGAALSLWIAALWLGTGVQLDEIARYAAYEVGFVIVPGWLVFRALVVRPDSRLHEVVFGWSLGYLLEISAFIVTAATGTRGAFYVYPLIVGVPAAVVARRRAIASNEPRTIRGSLPFGVIWIGALLCMVVLLYGAAVGFTQTPLPRDTDSVTYQEDTVFAVSLAAEALHHWPLTMPSVAAEPLRYHTFAFVHMAAISQVTRLDLSVVVMRMYVVPLLLLFALQLILVGRRIGRSWSAGLAALFAVVLLGELDVSTGSGVDRFLFRDFFFYWLLASHTFLLGLVFFLPLILVLSDLVTGDEKPRGSRLSAWVLFVALIVGCIGSKSYAVVVVGGALILFLLWTLLVERKLHRPTLIALALSALTYVGANMILFRWGTAGAALRPFRNLESMRGVADFEAYLGTVWGMAPSAVPDGLGAAFGIFGLLAAPVLGIALRLRDARTVSAAERLFLCFFVSVLPVLLLTNQPGFGQMFVVFFGIVPGTIVAGFGYLLWLQRVGPTLRATLLLVTAAAFVTFALDALLGVTPGVGLQTALLVVVAAAGIGAAVGLVAPRLRSPVAITVGVAGLLAFTTPLIALLTSVGNETRFSGSTAANASALALGISAIAAGALYALRQRSPGEVLVGVAATGTIALAVLNTPIDWFPHIVGSWAQGKPTYSQEYSGLTSGLYEGLRWIRRNTRPSDVLVVNNHSLHPDGSDSKYFYYSALAERRVVLESWDYTDRTAGRGYFSLPEQLSPYPRRLALSEAVFLEANERAARVLAHTYGARYFVNDKVHGSVSDAFTHMFPAVFSNDDVDVYDMGRPGQWRCPREQERGIAALFGHRRTAAEAVALRGAAEAVGFSGLDIQRRGCFDYAVVLNDLVDAAQAQEFRAEAATVGFNVTVECRSDPVMGGINAVFGHRRTKIAAERLAARAASVGFQGLVVQQDSCRDWEVDLRGLDSPAQREDFRNEAQSVGLSVTFEPG